MKFVKFHKITWKTTNYDFMAQKRALIRAFKNSTSDIAVFLIFSKLVRINFNLSSTKFFTRVTFFSGKKVKRANSCFITSYTWRVPANVQNYLLAFFIPYCLCTFYNIQKYRIFSRHRVNSFISIVQTYRPWSSDWKVRFALPNNSCVQKYVVSLPISKQYLE